MNYLTQLSDNVYQVRRSDVRENLTQIFEELMEHCRRDFSYLVATKRDDERLNGGAKYLEGLELDFRKFYYILVE